MDISKCLGRTFIVYRTLILFGLLLSFILEPNAQSIERQLISTTGNLSQTEQLTVSATAGETIIHTTVSAEIILTQGFQQPNENDFVGVWELDEIKIEVSIAPNPFTTSIYLTMFSDLPMNLTCSVFGVNGTMVIPPKRWEFQGETIKKIDFTPLPAGTYLLRLHSSIHKKTQTYKIIKQW